MAQLSFELEDEEKEVAIGPTELRDSIMDPQYLKFGVT